MVLAFASPSRSPYTPRLVRNVSTATVDMDSTDMYDPTGSHDDGALDMAMVADFGEDDEEDVRFDSANLDPGLAADRDIGAGHSQTLHVDDMFKAETGLDGGDDDDDDDSPAPTKRRRETQDVPGGFTYVDGNGESGRRKIRIEYITDKSRRHITFSKRKAGIMKKAYELSILTGTQVLLLVVSETGLVYTFTTSKLQPLVTKPEGKNLIQACLNAPEGMDPDGQPSGGPVPATKGKNGGLAIRPHKLTAAATAALALSSAQAAGQDEASAAQAAAHARAQVEAAQIGQGQPGAPAGSVAARPKKRLPSSAKKRSTSQANAAATESASQAGLDGVPPVPPIPDMHQQSSPASASASTSHLLPPTLHSPLGAAHPHGHPHQQYMHPDYHHGMPSPTYYPQPGEYVQQGYYPPGQGYVVHPMHYPPAMGQQGERRMLQEL